MNLQKLFEMQRQLDAHIEKEHPRQEDEDRLSKKILALQVELGELANEARFFKYWSNDQKPRTRIEVVTGQKMVDGVIEPIVEYKNPLLEEYVDGLHFLLSIGLEIAEPQKIDIARWNAAEADNITEQFLHVMTHAINLGNTLRNNISYYPFEYEWLFLRYIQLGEMLGFTWEQIEEAYLQKNAINHERQNNGY
ncbi:dUTP diphosphatase [Geobacillus thermodenitrificans]|uniref:dUTP diphosphatase n=1 Tax=Geobacillus thermodenitrificans TaxID=33940 RepID=UPI0009B1AD2F|nr:dUTP diphosphatase [Geobacillus thermodenitrificans]ARA98598.1 dUTPase [Geobacillus thermodenitrificans]